jgi:hypothetical protein
VKHGEQTIPHACPPPARTGGVVQSGPHFDL